MGNELTRAAFPRAAERERATRRARHSQRLKTGQAQIFVQHSDGVAADDILRTGDRERSNRDTAGECFELDHAERIGATWKDEHVCGGEMRGQGNVLQQSEKFCVREALSYRRLLWARADDDLRAGQIER